MSTDLTILYITLNLLPESWVRFQLDHLVRSARGAKIISVSRVPMNLGTNLLDKEPRSYWNLYMQMLRAFKAADTPYVAMAEDDVLYTPEHFWTFRPKLDEVSYDRSRWSLFTWGNVYCLRQRVSNCSMIGGREYLIEALEERRAKYPDGPPSHLLGEVGREKVDRRLGVSRRNYVEWYCRNPIVHLNHPGGTDTGDYTAADGRHMVKKHGQIQAYDIPYWGKAEDIIARYKNGSSPVPKAAVQDRQHPDVPVDLQERRSCTPRGGLQRPGV